MLLQATGDCGVYSRICSSTVVPLTRRSMGLRCLHGKWAMQGADGGVGLFVGGNFGFMLQAGADVVQASEQDFFARRRN